MGNDIFYLHITHPDGLSDRRGILIVGGVASEPMSVTGTLHFAQRLVTALELGGDEQLELTAKTSDIYILPILNVDAYINLSDSWESDGQSAYHAKNLVTTDCDDPEKIGIALDRNFEYKWAENDVGSSDDPCDDYYRGQQDFSENETEFLRDTFDQKDIAIMIVV